MKKEAILISAEQYLPSTLFPKGSIKDLPGGMYDIQALSLRFSQLGFSVQELRNATKETIISSINSTSASLINDSICIVYFTGHGGHYMGNNYIYAVDFPSEYDIKKNLPDAAIDIRKIISQFHNHGKLIMILDACRSDFGESKGYFSEMASAENVYIAYGTMFTGTASGASNGMSRFTEAICDEILAPDIDIDTVFTHVRRNVLRKHGAQIPQSVNTLISSTVLNPSITTTTKGQQVYDFVQEYGDYYDDKYGYFHGDDLVFIDAAQKYQMSLLDAIWQFRIIDNQVFRERGGSVIELTEDESKIVSFMAFTKGDSFFHHDEAYTWYYGGRQIRMGEIPPLPESMQQKMPEEGKAIDVQFTVRKDTEWLNLLTNLPENCELFLLTNTMKSAQKCRVSNGKLSIPMDENISWLSISSNVFSTDQLGKGLLGEKNRNLVGQYVQYHPIIGNNIEFRTEIEL